MSWSAFDTAEHLERRGVFKSIQPQGSSKETVGYTSDGSRVIIDEHATAAEARSTARQQGLLAWGRLTFRGSDEAIAAIREELK